MKIEIRSYDAVTVCGQKGTGKSHLERKLLAMYNQVFVFDPLDEFRDFPHYVPKTDSPMELDKIAKVIYDRQNCLLVVSEAELYMPVNMNLPPNVFKIVARGRHRNVGIIADTRRIASLNKTMFGLSEWCFVFRHFSPNDLDYLGKFIPEDVKKLRELEDFRFWVYHRNKVEVHDPVEFP